MNASNAYVQRQLHQLLETGSAVGLTDGQLLTRFATTRGTERDAAEAAFETILSRHGAMVHAVCRQLLGDVHAAEDAFQATFLVLVRRAATLRIREQRSLGPWLYGVAYRTALKARKCAARRRVREERVAIYPRHGPHRLPRPWSVRTLPRRSTKRSAGCRRGTARPWCSATSKAGLTTRPLPRFNGR